ncbi:MAG: polymer-forming cytoskeletal protein [Gammaproteobacteria bacterium]|nr:polymer-forming cytoskeletal protein [Gammaproteobacteria bacterium]
MNQLIDIRDQDYCFVGEGSEIKGSIVLRGTTHLASNIEGEVKVDSDSLLIIEREGIIDGTISCYDLEIYGKVKGKVISSGKITIFPSAEVNAELFSQSLVIFPGATVNMTSQTL